MKWGPTGLDPIVYVEYADITKCFLWSWNVQVLGRMPIDHNRELIFDGTNFMERFVTESGANSRRAVSLENWLIKKIQQKDASILNDEDWKYRTLWHELKKILEVSPSHSKTDASRSISTKLER